MIDSVLSRYGGRKYGIKRDTAQSITEASIVVWDEDRGDSVAELSDEQIQQRLAFGQAFAFSVMSMRRYSGHSGYCNSDTVTFVAQPFLKSAPSNVAVYSRRRDGASNNMIGTTEGLPVFMRPAHVELQPKIEIDEQLLAAITTASNRIGQRIGDSITLYLRANTDAREVPVLAEIVMLRAAMETLLGADHRTSSLRDAFNEHFRLDLTPPCWEQGDISEGQWRRRWPTNVNRPLDAWVQDFCASRNASAHGPSGEHSDPIWSVHEHMLFGSWLFPLIVKGVLAREGSYEMSWLDKKFRSEFERFFAYRLFVSKTYGKINWTEVEDDMRMADIARRMYPD